MLQHIKKLLVHNATLIAVLVTIAIAILSLTSVPKLNFGFNIKSSDKYLHILAYFVLSCVWPRVCSGRVVRCIAVPLSF